MTQPEPIPGTSKEIFRATRIFFGAIVGGTLIFVVIVIALNVIQYKDSVIKGYDSLLGLASVAIAAICLAAAWRGYGKEIAVVKDSLMPLADKLNQYRSALIRYMALCEFPAMFGIISFFVTGNYLILAITAVVLAAMFAKLPAKKRVVDHLGLDWQQQQELE